MTARTTTQGFFDPTTWTISYVVWDTATRHAAVIDPVLDYDFKSGHTGTASADKLLACVRDHGLQRRLDPGDPRARRSSVRRPPRPGAGRRTDRHRREHPPRAGRPSRSSSISNAASCRTAASSTTCSRMARSSGSATSKPPPCWCRATPPQTWPTWWTAPSSSATRSSCPTSAAHAPTFPAAMRASSTRRCAGCWTCRPTPRVYVCHDYPPASRQPRGRAPSPNSAPTTSMCATASARTPSSRCARPATRPWRCRRSSSPSIQVNVRAGRLPPADNNGVAYLRIPLNALPLSHSAGAGRAGRVQCASIS